MNINTKVVSEELSEPVTFGVEAYISEDYARAEQDKLWRKVWQHAGRVEDIANVGDFITYDILDDSILIVRTAPDTIKAYHNVCQHRGRRLVDQERGKTKQFVCGFHGWRWNLEGENTHILDQQDWKGCLTAENTKLPEVKCDTWGGWVWVNLDPDAGSLKDYLGPVIGMFAPFQLENMRYRWRQRVIFDCNWKTALEAFIESHHVEGTHPQLMKYADFYTWSKTYGLHSCHGFDERNKDLAIASSNTIIRPGKNPDARVSIAELQREVMETVNASTTQTLVDAAERLVHELPEGTPPNDVMMHFLESARRDDEARGVVWPVVDPEHYAKTGIDWHIFPNLSIQHGFSFLLSYRTRPYKHDPNKCIFETAVLELFPKGQEPKTEWVYAEATVEKWRSVLAQDFSNMKAVQEGMKSMGFKGPRPNPYQERPIGNFHRNLAKFMGAGAPRPIE